MREKAVIWWVNVGHSCY